MSTAITPLLRGYIVDRVKGTCQMGVLIILIAVVGAAFSLALVYWAISVELLRRSTLRKVSDQIRSADSASCTVHLSERS